MSEVRLIDANALKANLPEPTNITQRLVYRALCDFIDNAPTVEPQKEIVPVCKVNFDKDKLQEIVDKKIAEMIEQPQGELTDDESRLIGVAVDYLLGAELLEENGWSENDIKVLQSLRERYYVEDSEEEE